MAWAHGPSRLLREQLFQRLRRVDVAKHGGAREFPVLLELRFRRYSVVGDARTLYDFRTQVDVRLVDGDPAVIQRVVDSRTAPVGFRRSDERYDVVLAYLVLMIPLRAALASGLGVDELPMVLDLRCAARASPDVPLSQPFSGYLLSAREVNDALGLVDALVLISLDGASPDKLVFPLQDLARVDKARRAVQPWPVRPLHLFDHADLLATVAAVCDSPAAPCLALAETYRITQRSGDVIGEGTASAIAVAERLPLEELDALPTPVQCTISVAPGLEVPAVRVSPDGLEATAVDGTHEKKQTGARTATYSTDALRAVELQWTRDERITVRVPVVAFERVPPGTAKPVVMYGASLSEARLCAVVAAARRGELLLPLKYSAAECVSARDPAVLRAAMPFVGAQYLQLWCGATLRELFKAGVLDETLQKTVVVPLLAQVSARREGARMALVLALDEQTATSVRLDAAFVDTDPDEFRKLLTGLVNIARRFGKLAA